MASDISFIVTSFFLGCNLYFMKNIQADSYQRQIFLVSYFIILFENLAGEFFSAI